ncbi:zinc ribbon domain-containing protein [Gloeothece verrucosa]|uniref:Transposase, IS605 OrfB family n=1 Tax=Gloeothece verrucosa (strain PCC 7822) TaxID=497965 RepID=E0UC69_GLOV7|nr:zinc ribbon domain-containing protein [Gloeothece verrucosa]ADN16407.1 transposase, IS605 OrfB family [Gloeothece verrucosa PCC 7822]
MAKPTKTIKRELTPRKLEWLARTKVLFNQVVEFYVRVLSTHPNLLNTHSDDLYSVFERLTISNKKHPCVPYPLPWSIPAMLRRAAIKKAYGVYQSWHSHRQRWEKQKNKATLKGKKFAHRPPLLTRKYNFSVQFYKGAWKGTGVENELLLNLWTGTSWTWVKYKISGRDLPDNWKALSPTVVVKGNKPRLHIPLEKENFNYPKKLEVQTKKKDFKIVAVDLNMGDKLAVFTLLNSDGKALATKFIKGGSYLQSRRKRLLGKIAKSYSKTGIISSGHSRHKWDKIKQIQDYEAHRISRRIVDWATSQGANVIVFEHLGNLKPQKGKYSHKQNQKRAYWLKSKIFDYTKYKAFTNGIITSRVNPANTSRLCACCGEWVSRHHADEPIGNYRVGADNFTCLANPLHRGDADRNASVNIGLKFLSRYDLVSLKGKPLVERPRLVSGLYIQGKSLALSGRRVGMF